MKGIVKHLFNLFSLSLSYPSDQAITKATVFALIWSCCVFLSTASSYWFMSSFSINTVKPRFHEPLYNGVLGSTNDILQPGQSYSKMYGTDPRYNEPRYNEIPVITSTTQKPKRKMYPEITNKFRRGECKTNQQG